VSGELPEIALALERACGIVFSDRHGPRIRSGFAAGAAALGLDPPAFLRLVRAGDRDALRALVDCSVVGESHFCRHPEQLEAIRAAIRPRPPDGPLRVWSAGCASGEEAYTIAGVLLEEGRAAPACVLATDVSARAIAAAQEGVYGPWSLRGLPGPARTRWLRPEGERWTVLPELRRLVGFRTHNLVADPPPPGAFDVVLCRNVLIYFDRPTAEHVLRMLFDAVRPGGLVALAPTEISLAEPLGFERIEHPGGALWRKAPAGGAARAPARAPGRTAGAARSAPDAPRTAPQPAPPPRTAPAAAPGSGREPDESGRTPDPLEAARRAAAEGRWLDAEREASAVGERQLRPEPFLFAAAAAEARGDPAAALGWLGRALFLDPGHAVARASMVPLLERTGRPEEAARARRLALEALESVPGDALLPGVEPIAAGALRSALSGWRGEEVGG
jgi:chemotaxis protein methyltransferase CheR